MERTFVLRRDPFEKYRLSVQQYLRTPSRDGSEPYASDNAVTVTSEDNLV